MSPTRAGDRTRTGDVHARELTLQSANPCPDTELHGIIPPRNGRIAPKSRGECATNVQSAGSFTRPRATPAQIAAANRAIARNPDRHRARVAVKDALRRGKLVKGRCALADRDCSPTITAHHSDYSQPLAVTWLCASHHRRLHLGQVAA